MGFPYATIRIPKFRTITMLLYLLCYIKFMAVIALKCLGDYKPAKEDQSVEHLDDDFIPMDRPSPSLVPLPINIVMTPTDICLPVLEYHEFLKRHGVKEDEDAVCAVCLNGFERSQEIRELSNCAHLFHRRCLDSWVDAGKDTCPLCRSMILPKESVTTSDRDPWMLDRNAYLFGDD